MDIRERKAVLVAIAVVLLMALFPPWLITIRNANDSCGYAFLATPPSQGTQFSGPCSIDFVRLFMQWVAVAGATALYIGWERLKRLKQNGKG